MVLSGCNVVDNVAGKADYQGLTQYGEEISCDDFDGVDFYQKSITTFNEHKFSDRCFNNSLLEEGSCKEGDFFKIEKECTEINSNSLCWQGECRQTVFKENLVEIHEGHNAISESRINLIFDCQDMTETEFEECVQGIPFMISVNESFVMSWEQFGSKKGGLFQLNPFKESVDLFNFWYVNRSSLSLPSGCEVNFEIEKSIRNPIIVARCNQVGSSYATHYPIIKKKLDENAIIQSSQNGESVISSIFISAVAGKISSADAYNLNHEVGHAIGGLNDEYSKNGGIGFPNCAKNQSEADTWWKDTGLLKEDAVYYSGCKDEEFLITNPNTILKGSKFNTEVVDVSDYFSILQKYWICRNIYKMTGEAKGICRDFKNDFSFERLLYYPK